MIDNKKIKYKSPFYLILSLPLIIYVVIVLSLIYCVFSRINYDALTIVLNDSALLASIRLSLITSFISTALAILVALPSGYILSRKKLPGHDFIDTILDLPIVLPPLIIGLSVLIFFNTAIGRWLDRGIWNEGLFIYQPLGIVLVQFIIGCAITIRVTKSGFDSLDESFEQLAMTLGANRFQTFFKVVLPGITPTLIAATVITWARIFGLFGPVLLIAGTMRNHTEIMPTSIFLEISIGRIEVALVLGALMILISTIALVLFKKLGGRGFLW